MSHKLPSIFVIKQHTPNGVAGFALAEDGTGLVMKVESSDIYLRNAMGILSRQCHDVYDEHYPNGYILVDYLDASDEDLVANDAFAHAYAINHGQEV